MRSLKLISPEIPSLKIYLEVSQVLWNLIKKRGNALIKVGFFLPRSLVNSTAKNIQFQNIKNRERSVSVCAKNIWTKAG